MNSLFGRNNSNLLRIKSAIAAREEKRKWRLNLSNKLIILPMVMDEGTKPVKDRINTRAITVEIKGVSVILTYWILE